MKTDKHTPMTLRQEKRFRELGVNPPPRLSTSIHEACRMLNRLIVIRDKQKKP